MSQPLSPEVDRVRKLVAQADSDAPLSPDQREHLFDVFQEHECWEPFFRLVRRSIEDPSARQLKDYVRLARVQNLYLEDVFAAAETCVALVEDLNVGYRQFSEEVLPQIVEFEDFAAEATILNAVSSSFKEQDDLVACLERLCMLYEKKTHNEALLGKTYEKLLATQPTNVKALRYFKLAYTQNNEWEDVVTILKTLLVCVNHPQELFRVAQELAAIYLYQLDSPQEAIKTLDTYCAESPLDTSTILFDAYQRIGDWRGCLRVLRQCLLDVDDDIGRAILHYKSAGLHEHLGELDAAIENYTKAARLWPQFIDAIEGVVTVGVAKRDWGLIHTWLETLVERVQDERLRSQLRQAARRLQDGIAHATRD